jgi:hypothetical protein
MQLVGSSRAICAHAAANSWRGSAVNVASLDCFSQLSILQIQGPSRDDVRVYELLSLSI